MELTYDQLNHSSTHIRLLRILPAPRTLRAPWHSCVNIQCELFTTPLESAPDFEALSYQWGPKPTKDEVPITVNNQPVLAWPNVAHALAALRTNEPRILWIDALCINQGNAEEKNHQVNLMGDIYRRATRVLVWLGRSRLESDSIVTDALKLVKVLGDEPPYSELPPPPPVQHDDGQAELRGWVRDIIHGGSSHKAVIRPESAKKRLRDPYDVGTGQVCSNGRPLRASYASLAQERRKWVMKRWKVWEDYRAGCEHRRYLRPWLLERFKELKMAGHDDFIREKVTNLPSLRASQAQQRQRLLVVQAQCRGLQLQLDALRARALLDLRDKQLESVSRLWRHQKSEILPLNADEILDEFSKEELELEEWLDMSHHTDPEAISAGDATEQVLDGMGRLQRVVTTRAEALSDCHRLSEGSSGLSPRFPRKILELKKRHLVRLKLEEAQQKRQLSTLQEKMHSWQRLEDNQDEELRLLEETEDEQLRKYISRWDGAHDQAIQQGDGERRSIEAMHFSEMADYVETRLQRLQDLVNSHAPQCSEAVLHGLGRTPLLSEEGVQILHAANTCRRRAHLQRLKLRCTTLQLTLPELLPKQYQKWKAGLYLHARTLPTATEDRKRMPTEWTNTQVEFAQRWDEWHEDEVEEWISILGRHASVSEASGGLGTLLLGLASVCRLPYWRRLWIVQEVLLAKQAVLCFGDDNRTTCDWEMLTMARESLEKIPDSWQIDPAIASKLRIIQASLPFQLDGLRARRKERWSLLRLLDITETSLCQDPRDKIYGLLGIANDVQGRPIEINYSATKSLGEVYHDVIQWHQDLYGNQEGCANLVKFSQAVQASFKGHSDPWDPNTPPSPAVEPPSALPHQYFQCKLSIHGSVTVVEPLLEGRVLLKVRGRDRICVMLDYLDTTGDYQSRATLEHELLRLDSIVTDLDAQGTSFVYSCGDFSAPKPAAQNQALTSNNKKRKKNEPHFFIAGQGAFGVASSSIKDADVLCQYTGTDVAVILRPVNDQYTVVSKAILLPSRTPALPATAPFFHMEFDAAALQGLTAPLELSGKHRRREPLYIQESSFGWYEFITHGITTPVSIYRRAPAATPAPKNKGSPKWRSLSAKASIWGFVWLWHMLREPRQQSGLLSRAAAFINRGEVPDGAYSWQPGLKMDNDVLAGGKMDAFQELAEMQPFGPRGRVRLGFAMDAMFVCPQVLKDAFTEARKRSAHLITSHVTRPSMTDALPSAVTTMHDSRLLGPDILLSHANHVSADELRYIEASGTHMYQAHRCLNCRWDTGTRSVFSPSSYTCLPWEQTRIVTRARRIEKQTRDRAWDGAIGPTAEDTYNLGTILGAQAISLDHEIGSLMVGKKADIVIFHGRSPSMLSAADRNPVAAIVLHSSVRDVRTVIVDGVIRKDKFSLARIGIPQSVAQKEESDVNGAESIQWDDVARELDESRRTMEKARAGVVDEEAARAGLVRSFMKAMTLAAGK